jgi:hypothetical protein
MEENKNGSSASADLVTEPLVPVKKRKSAPRAKKSSENARAVDIKSVAKTQKKKPKLIRDSFTMPQDDFDLIAKIKARTLNHKRPAKKSELLRAGLVALNALSDSELLKVLNRLAPLKAGRPKKAT